MNQTCKISVVIPLYNKAPHIARAVNSVLSQKEPVNEILIIDDGSTDESVDVVRSMSCDRILLIQQQNSGVSVARNTGIKNARNPLVAFLDADDAWLPTHIETLKRLYASHPQCGAFASARMLGKEGEKPVPLYYHNMPSESWEGVLPNYFVSAPCSSSTVMVPKYVFEKVGLFPIGERIGEDLDMWCRIALQYPIAFSKKNGAIKYEDSINKSRHYGVKQERYGALLATLEHTLLNRPALPRGIEYNDIREYRDSVMIYVAVYKVLAGQSKQARQLLFHARESTQHPITRRKWIVLSYFPNFILRYLAKKHKNIYFA
jgi:glycosyltransferase involved in cell wall biosynthesis